MTRTLALATLLLAIATPCAADVVPAADQLPPGYRVRLVDRDAIAGRTLVAVDADLHQGHGDVEPQASYVILDDAAVMSPRRICAVPTEWVQASPVGQLGPRMLRGARAASGAISEGMDAVTELHALFDGVSCAFLSGPDRDPAHPEVEAVEDTFRASLSGETLTLTRTQVSYQIGATSVTLPAAADGSRPPPPSPSHGACGCSAGATPAPGWIALGLVALVLRRRHRA